MKIIILLISVLCCQVLWANVVEDFDSLGGNEALLEQAQALEPNTKIKIVQKRLVDRVFRNELSFEMATSLGGDAYLDTNSLSAVYHFHINPRWSIGAKYEKHYNALTNEAKRLQEFEMENEEDRLVPVQDWATSSNMLLLNWYPIYGKFSAYDLGVVQFDAYLTIGTGKIKLPSGTKPVQQYGLGMGFWISKNYVSRIEFRNQSYELQRLQQINKTNITQATLSVGILL